jgi:hypothetical protein
MGRILLIVGVLAVLAAAGCRPLATPVRMAPGSTTGPLSPLLTPSAPQIVPEATHQSPPAPVATSGIRLKATIGPTCPGPERPGQVCTRPYEGLFVVTDSTGVEAARASTRENGTVTINLPPGNYTITPQVVGRFPSGAPTTVTVLSGQYVEVGIELDSGIR